MKAIRHLTGILILAALPALADAPPTRLLYLQAGLASAAQRTNTLALLERVAAEGYTGVVFTDYKFMRWDDLPPGYHKHWQELHDTCKRLKLKLIAGVMPMGYSNSLLSRDPNLAEGLPVRNAPFIVRNGMLVPNETIPLANGGFEGTPPRAHCPRGWNTPDQPGLISFVDSNTVAEGRASLRMQDVARHESRHRHARIWQTLHLSPFRNYHVSVSVKTLDWNGGDTRIMALGENGQPLNFQILPLDRTQDWKRIDITFNTLDSTDITLYLGTWDGNTGTIWWDDVKVEPAGFVNVLRRGGTPLTLTSPAGGVSYEEGRDFEMIRDPLMGMDPWAGDYTSWHTPPTVRILPGGRLQEGQRVRASFYHAVVIYEGSVACCMSDPGVYTILTDQARVVRDAIQPDGYMMMHDEIRCQGWDDSCARRNLNPAEILKDNVGRCVAILNDTDPGKPLYIWSDMFDPFHNARTSGSYFLVKGNAPWSGAWAGLPADVTVVNWQMGAKTRRDTLKHFSSLGHKQILAGYYDGDPAMIRDWLKDARGIPGIEGVMYTTWRSDFTRTRDFLKALP